MRKILLLFVLVLGVAAVPAVARATTVAVYDDPNFVDTTDPDPGDAESDNVQASLTAFGHNVKLFDGTDGADFSGGLAGARLLVIPELENGDLAPALTPSAVHVLRTYVATGGGLILFHNNDINLLNTVFGYNVASGTETPPATKTPESTGTAFAGGPATLPSAFSSTAPLVISGLPAAASVMYSDGGNAWVTTFTYGSGVIVYLAWDWFDAQPLGANNDGWLSVLRRAVTEVAGAGCTVSGTPGVDSLTGTSGADRICGFGGSDEIAGRGGKDVILAGGGHDEANGGTGNDKVVGGPGADTVRGNKGRDFLDIRDGVHGNDSAVGGPGSDTCRRDSGDAVASC